MTDEEFVAVLALDGSKLVIEPSSYKGEYDKWWYAGLEVGGLRCYGKHAATKEEAVALLRTSWEKREAEL